jgi:hypothetical protein
MKTKPDDDLLQEIFTESASDDFRAAALERTLISARRQRRLRRAGRVCGAIAICAAILGAIFWHTQEAASDRVARNSIQSPTTPQTEVPTVPGTSIRLVSDDELLGMFPDRPVALVGPPANQRFVFLDELPGAKAGRRGSSDRGLKL